MRLLLNNFVLVAALTFTPTLAAQANAQSHSDHAQTPAAAESPTAPAKPGAQMNCPMMQASMADGQMMDHTKPGEQPDGKAPAPKGDKGAGGMMASSGMHCMDPAPASAPQPAPEATPAPDSAAPPRHDHDHSGVPTPQQ